jgi:hypothetical protein
MSAFAGSPIVVIAAGVTDELMDIGRLLVA